MKRCQLRSVLVQHLENRLRLEAGVEQRGFARDLVPEKIAMHGVAAARAADLTELPPEPGIHRHRLPAPGQRGQLRAIEADYGTQRVEVWLAGEFARIFEHGEIIRTQSGGLGRRLGGHIQHRPCFPNHIAGVVFQIHVRVV